MTMVGGYAVKSSDTTNGSMEYTPVKTMSVWTDIHTNGKNIRSVCLVDTPKTMGRLMITQANTMQDLPTSIMLTGLLHG
ncbi:MAG: hypothetical protein R2759_20650 [Bacteroidales bacterium]